MQLYSAKPAQCAWQIVADLVAIGTMVIAVIIANIVRSAIASLAAFGEQVESAGTTFGDTLADAADGLQQVPVVGQGVSEPFVQASEAAEQLAEAGRQGRDTILAIADGVGIAFWLLPLLILALVWLIPRLRFVLRTRATAKVVEHPAGTDVLALRAISTASFADVVALVPDPLEAIRTGDRAAIRALASLELRSRGVRVPTALRSSAASVSLD